jgi:hypothetical protein
MRTIAAIVSLLCLCGCTGRSGPESDLTGKWLTTDSEWGIEFRGSRVFEWEEGEIQNEGTFTFATTGSVFSCELKTEDNLILPFRMEVMGNRALFIAGGEEPVELRKQ